MELRRLGVKVWYDKFTLKIGDSLCRSIDSGLANSRYGVLVLSKAFLQKPWPEYELRGLVAKEIGREKVILPIWYKITKSDILGFSPPLADKLAIVAKAADTNEIARQLVEVVRPDIFEHIHRIETLNAILRAAPLKKIPIKKIKPGTVIRHERLTPQQMVRIRNIRYILRGTYKSSLDEDILAFKKDLRIDSEIFIWEAIAAAYATYRELFDPSVEELAEVFRGLLISSMGMLEDFLERDDFKHLDRKKREVLIGIWARMPDEVEFTKRQ